MEDNNDSELKAEKWYLVSEAAPFLRLKEMTLKKKLRENLIKGKQVGTKKVWYIQGKEIIKLRQEWNLEGI